MPIFSAMSPNARGILATCIAMIGFIGTDSCIKLASQEMPVSQMIVLRGIAMLAILIALAFATGAQKKLPTLKDKPVWLRALGECMATLLFYNAIIQIPIANANAVLQTIPLAMVAVAAILFKEKVGWRRWSVVIVGFFGILLVIQPGGDGFMPASLWAVAAVVFFVIRDMATRSIDPRLPAVSINLVTCAAVMLMGVVLSLFQDWVSPTPQGLMLLGLSACFLTLGYLAVTVAMRSGDVSVTSPFRYSIVLWALLIDALVFGNRPDLTMIIGMSIVVASGIYMIFREQQIKRATAKHKAA
ncbi:MAG: DMT family transporter [Devosiaceae bacterium]